MIWFESKIELKSVLNDSRGTRYHLYIMDLLVEGLSTLAT